MRVRFTRAGMWFLVLLFGVLFAAVNTGNNLLYLVLSALCGLLVLNNLLSEWNMRGLVLGRQLPGQAFAHEPAAGRFVLRNNRSLGHGWGIHVEDCTHAGEVVARSLVLGVAAGAAVDLPADWVYPARGRVEGGRLRVWSSHPFGLVRRARSWPTGGGMLVYPEPVHGTAARVIGPGGATEEDPRRRGQVGELQGLRPYQAGDPLRAIHWPTTARVGTPMVVERADAGITQVVVEVHPSNGEAWERALSRACGAVLHHAGRGHAVGLDLGEAREPPRAGVGWCRHLLGQLARAPRR